MHSPNKISISPATSYQADLADGSIVPDPNQLQVVEQLEAIYQSLISDKKETGSRFWFGRKSGRPAIKGLYIWGTVGRGKTYLMDLFYDSVPQDKKLRIHFHRFMSAIHNDLKSVNHHVDPLTLIAKRWAQRYQVICLDEFFVNDITDAMILSTLLKTLFAEKTIILTTSNIEPDGLYKNGLQRDRFLPAIAQIKNHMTSIELSGNLDHRSQLLSEMDNYLFPLNAENRADLHRWFIKLTSPEQPDEEAITINDRTIEVVTKTRTVIWFEFAELCQTARSVSDYIDLAECYQFIIIANIPVLKQEDDNAARRFLNLIDELYDRRVKIVMSAETTITDIYQGTELQFEYERLISRVTEMQSESYNHLAHLSAPKT